MAKIDRGGKSVNPRSLATAKEQRRPEQMPAFIDNIINRYPAVWQAYQQLGVAAKEAGPIDPTSQRIVKLALAVGARSQGSVHSHARRGIREGIPIESLLQVPILAISSIGWSAAMAALSWILDATDTPNNKLISTTKS